MRQILHFVCSVLLGIGSAHGQQKPKEASPKPPAIVSIGPVQSTPGGLFFPLVGEPKAAIRDLQYERQHLEIEKQQMKVKIAEIERRQDAIDYQMQGIAFDFAAAHHVDLAQFHLEPRTVAFVPNEKPQ